MVPADESMNHTEQHASLRLIRNSAWMVLSRGVAILSVLASVPVVLSRLGNEGFGRLEALLALTNGIMLMQACVSGTILWRSSACCGAADSHGTRRTLQIGLSFSLLSMALLVPLAYAARHMILALIQIPAGDHVSMGWLVPAVVLTTVLTGASQCLLSVISGYQRSGMAALIQSLGIVTTNLTLMVSVLWGAGIEALFYAAAAGFCVTVSLAVPLAFRCCRQLRLYPTLPTTEELHRLAPYAGLLLLSSLSVVFRDQLDKILLTSLTTPGVNADYSIAQRLAGLVMQVCAVLFVPMTAAFAAAHAAGNSQAVTSNFLKWSRWMARMTGLATAAVITLRSALLVLWLGHDWPQAHLFIGILILATGISVIFSGPGVALAKGLGMPGLETRYAMLTLVLVLLLKPLLCIWFGPTYAVVASAVSWVLGAIFFFWMLHRHVQLPAACWTDAWSTCALTLVTSGMGWWLGGRPWATPAGRLSALGLVLVVTPLIGLVFIVAAMGRQRSTPAEAERELPTRSAPLFWRRKQHESATAPIRA